MTPKELEGAIRMLLQRPMADAALRGELEELAASEISFSGFTWLWGPELYRRNRVLFRPFILSRFSTWMQLPKWRSESIRWKGDKANILDAWLAEVDRNDDPNLFCRLYDWKLSERFDWRKRDARSREICGELVSRFRSAATAAARQMVLRKFELWFQMEEETAIALYSIDAGNAGPYILKRLKSGWLSGEPKRVLWSGLLEAAVQKRDEEFRWKLYRRQVPAGEWTRDCLTLCDRVRDPAELNLELEKRSPEGWGMNLADGFYQLVQKRGRDVFPYVMRHLRQVWGGWLTRGKYGKMADYAREQGWWDLWSALIRTCAGPKEFNQVVQSFLEDSKLGDAEVARRLLALIGVSREWNWGGLGIAAVHQLDEPVALALYERFPDLLRGPFKVHVQAHIWGKTYPKLLRHFIEKGDEELIDYMASRLVTRQGRWGNAQKMVDEAEELANYYRALKSDEAVFSRRAASVLNQVPAYSITNYNVLIKVNSLARLLFERSSAAFLADPLSMPDLVEAAEIHVQALAYRALGMDDPRAREQASRHMTLLLGTLLRPLQRETRCLAFKALANAAGTAETARLILDRAREALSLPDVKYPKEKLLGLIAQLLHRWPELRKSSEQPVVYGRTV